MAILNQKRILNLIPKISAPVTLHVSQGDIGTEIQFTLVKGDELFVNPGNVSASVHGVREDGANFGAFTCTLSGSTVSFPLHSEMTAVKGSALAEIVIVDNNGNKVGSANFAILVEESVFPLGVTYDNDVSVYESILAYVQTIPAQVEADFNTAIAQEASTRSLQIQTLTADLSAETTARQLADSTEASTRAAADIALGTRIDQIIAPSGKAPSVAEVTDARIGYDNTVYNSLGDAIRGQIDFVEKNIEQVLKDSIQWKSLSSVTKDGLTYTVNATLRKITVSGVASSNSFMYLVTNISGVSKIIFSGTPSDKLGKACYVGVFKDGAGIVGIHNPSERLTVVNLDPNSTYYVSLYIAKNMDLTTPVVFYPKVYIYGDVKSFEEDKIDSRLNENDILFENTKQKFILKGSIGKKLLSVDFHNSAYSRIIKGNIDKKSFDVAYRFPVVIDDSETFNFDVGIATLISGGTRNYINAGYGTDIPFTPSGEAIYMIFEWDRTVDYGGQGAYFYLKNKNGTQEHFTVFLFKSGDGLKGRTIINLSSIIANNIGEDIRNYYGGQIYWISTAGKDFVNSGYGSVIGGIDLNIRFLGLFTQSDFSYGYDLEEKVKRDHLYLSRSAGFYRDALPTYWIDFPTTIESFNDADDYLNSKCKNIPVEGKNFIFVTDTHWRFTNSQNAEHSPDLCGYISSRYDVDRCIYGGDVVDIEDTKYKGLGIMNKTFHRFREVFGEKFMPTLGNHDQNTPNMQSQTSEYIAAHMIPFTEISPVFLNEIKGVRCYYPVDKVYGLFTDTEIPVTAKNELLSLLSLFYYVDDHSKKVRYICLNTGTPSSIEGNVLHDYFGNGLLPIRLAMDWFYDALMGTPVKYDVVVFGHQIISPTDPTDIGSHPVKQMLTMITGFLKKETSIKVYYSRGGDTPNVEKWIYGSDTTSTYIDYNFLNAPNIGKLLVICGDGHYDTIRVFNGTTTASYSNIKYDGVSVLDQSTGEFPIVMVNTDGYLVDHNREYPFDGTEADGWNMEVGTTTEQSFDVVSLVKDGIQFTRIGAGEDRKIKIKDCTIYDT